MRDGGRLSAATEILTEIIDRHRPAKDALKDWGIQHRFAGSSDRTIIGNLVFDVLRCKSSLSWRVNSDNPRLLVLCAYSILWNNGVEKLQTVLELDKYAPEGLSETERKSIECSDLKTAPSFVKADVPEWLWPSFQANFDEEAVAEGCALSNRPPIDIRVNLLKSTRDKIEKKLVNRGGKLTSISPVGVRIDNRQNTRKVPNIKSEEGYQKGWFEIQDEGSQIASLLVNAQPKEQILDYCSGGGGKTLALAAEMDNTGQIHAYDSDKSRLSSIYQRLSRAGARNVQVLDPSGNSLENLVDKMDRVLVDAPCSGTGVWRRLPDSKWRISENSLETRIIEQEKVLIEASKFVRVGGYLIYVTCSVLPEENEQQVYAFETNFPNFEVISVGEVWQDRFGFDAPKPWSSDMKTITLTPASTATDGFYIAVLVRNR